MRLNQSEPAGQVHDRSGQIGTSRHVERMRSRPYRRPGPAFERRGTRSGVPAHGFHRCFAR
jgi:hypothetical protein